MNDIDPPPVVEVVRHRDGYEASARWWGTPSPRGAVLYLHGIQSHGGWYEGAGAHLARADFAVLMPDRRGSGLNAAQRGHVEGPQTWLDDMEDLLQTLRDRTGLTRAHVVGVSWGGKLAATAAASDVRGIASLTLIAPGIYPRIDLPMGQKMRVAWSLVSEPRRRFPIPLDDARLFTNNPERIAWVDADALRLRSVTGSFLVASHRLDRAARGLPRSHWRGPVHLLLAEHDRIIDNARTRDWFAALPDGAHRRTEYAGAYHTLEFETDPTPMHADVLEWLAVQ
ncbi:MAG: alpha/beta fold hydrolase [Phycisphaerae bacterium]|nr:lysophospholipase [Phycisphaerae bacterium]NUQ47185.1 alpha/beta fold hydrolase [Phycisphaerae bacterium]